MIDQFRINIVMKLVQDLAQWKFWQIAIKISIYVRNMFTLLFILRRQLRGQVSQSIFTPIPIKFLL